MSVEDNKAVVRRFTQALDSNNLSILPEICTPACADMWSQGINSDPWSDHHVALKQLVAEGDHVVAIVETRGRIVGTYYGVPGRGKSFTNKGAVVYRFENQKSRRSISTSTILGSSPSSLAPHSCHPRARSLPRS
jgi:hypothetical protein